MENTRDRWMDVKTPGDGRTYSVGCTLVIDTKPESQPRFSNAPISGPPSIPPIDNGSGHQVVVLQAVDAQQNIIWQRYFHGYSQEQEGRHTFARAISVLPHEDPLHARIAIVGETCNKELPLAFTAPYPTDSLFSYTGFLAVYNGDGDLLWTYQFYGRDRNANTALTGVSIRTKNGQDEVTYCGISTNGDLQDAPGYGPATTMEPLRPFAAPGPYTVGSSTDTYSSGSTHQAATSTTPTQQWDGFVGRMSAPHILTANPQLTRHFHSLVGGPTNDVLLGLAEVDDNNFVVVGAVFSPAQAAGSPSGNFIPLINPEPFNDSTATPRFTFSSSPYGGFGTFFWFDATGTRSAGNLSLPWSALIGSAEQATTVARSVIAHGGKVWIVGSTNDPAFTTLDPMPVDGTLNGTTAGFLLTTSLLAPGVPFTHASYVESQVTPNVESHCIGIGAWNEFHDHATITGWTVAPGTLHVPPVHHKDMFVESWFWDSQWNVQPPATGARLRQVRSAVLGGEADNLLNLPGDDLPGLTAGCFLALNPLTFGTGWGSGWELAGGGIDVDQRGRVHAVGSTSSGGTTAFPGPAFPIPSPDRANQPGHVAGSILTTDGVRVALDMLPSSSSAAACRTDLTGNLVPSGWVRDTLYTGDGGTTPTCGLNPFGNPMGNPHLGNLPPVQRQLIDFEGTLAAGSTDAAILLDRPAPTSTVQGSAMLVGLPSTSPVPFSGMEAWIPSTILNPSVSQFYFSAGWSLRVPLGQLPAAGLGINFSIQFVSMIPVAHSNCDPRYIYVGSPALIFSY